MLAERSLKVVTALILIFIFAGLNLGSASTIEDEITLGEGEIVEIQDGYYLSITDVNTYDGNVRFVVSYYDTIVLDQYYPEGEYFYYQDDYLTLQFWIDDVYYDSFYNYDYVLLSDIYIYPDHSVTYDGSDGRTYDKSDDNVRGYDTYSDYPDYSSYSDTSSEDEFYEMFGTLIVVFIAVLILRKMSKRKKAKKVSSKEKEQMASSPVSPPEKAHDNAGSVVPDVSGAGIAGVPSSKNEPVLIKSAVQYKGANIIYKIKVENTSEEPMGDISINLFVPDVFYLKEDRKNISMLQPGEGKTTTFVIRPTGECGNCIIAGKIRYYDYSKKKHVQADLSNKMVDIVCPVLRLREVDENTWRQNVSSMMIAEEDTKDLEIPAENLFDIATRILKDMNMFMIAPEITSTQQLFTGVARFYAEGVAGLRYAAYIEVVGKRTSRLIVKAWAEKEEALTGFYHKILEEIEKRTDIKIFVDDSLTQYNISNTTIQDSIIQRSNIGNGKKKCPQCGREVGGNEKFCINCGQKLE